MKMRMRATICLAVMELGLAMLPGQSLASGGDSSPELSSVSRRGPEREAVAGYLHGHLGVLLPSYDNVYLMMAYRQAAGLPALSAADEALLLDPVEKPQVPVTDATESNDPMAIWLRERKRALATDPAYAVKAGWLELGEYRYTDNCQGPAFAMASKTLAERSSQHAKEPEWLRAWLAGQDSVFSACDPKQSALDMPVLPANAPKWLVQDRAYQSAARLFYQQKLGEAAQAFETISRDKASPWRDWAAYLTVRTWWRDNFKEAESYRKLLETAPDWRKQPNMLRLQEIAATAKDTEVADAARSLYDALATRFDPLAAYHGLWRKIEGKAPVEDIGAWVRDEHWVRAMLKPDDYADEWLTANWPNLGELPGAPPVPRKALPNWRDKANPIWLASAMMIATQKTPGQEEMCDASRKFRATHPLYVHFAWQRTRLALTGGDYVAARKELAAIREALSAESLGTRQQFDQLDMIAAPTLEQVGQHLLRKAVSWEYWDDEGLNITLQLPDAPKRDDLLDVETRQWLAKYFSGREMLQLAQAPHLPPNIRKDLAGEAWRRAIFLADAALEQQASRQIGELADDKLLLAATEAATPDEMRFRMARNLLLKAVPRVAGYLVPSEPNQNIGYWDTPPQFHDAAFKRQQAADLAILSKGNETTWMGQQILPWMNNQPRFAEAPAILEKLVYASRYGMRDTATSRRAFVLLHKQYPASPEAVRTKYYY